MKPSILISLPYVSFALGVNLFVSGCDQGSSPSAKSHSAPALSSTSAGSLPQLTAAESGPNKSKSQWSYSKYVDPMRGTKTEFASIESTNEVSFDFPYKGGRGNLTLAQDPGSEPVVSLEVDGQFLCDSYPEDYVAAKFDNGKIENYFCAEPSNGTKSMLFIDPARKFVRNLKRSKSLIVEADFYAAGHRQFTFDVTDLKWK